MVLESEAAEPVPWNKTLSSSILEDAPASNGKYIRVLSFTAQNIDAVKKNGDIIYSQKDTGLPVHFFLSCSTKFTFNFKITASNRPCFRGINTASGLL